MFLSKGRARSALGCAGVWAIRSRGVPYAKLALWRYDYNNVRQHSSLGNKTPAEARRTLEQFECSAPGALSKTKTEDYDNQTRRLSL